MKIGVVKRDEGDKMGGLGLRGSRIYLESSGTLLMRLRRDQGAGVVR